MRARAKSFLIFVPILLVCGSFVLCQKGTGTGKGTSTTVVAADEAPIKFEQVEAEGKELPKPPKVYVGPWGEKGSQPKLYKAAQEQFEKKNYKAALTKYNEFIESDPKNYWAARGGLQTVLCHYQLSEYDEALDGLKKFLESKPGLLWEARTMAALAELYLVLPYYGYEKNEKLYYNTEHREGEYRYMGDEHRDIAVTNREKTRLAYVALLSAPASKRGAADGDDPKSEALVNSFSLVDTLENQYWNMSDRCPPSEPLDPPAPGSLYDPDWTPREKVLFLLDETNVLNQGRKDRHPEAWAGFKKTLFLMRFPECPTEAWMKKEDKLRQAWNKKQKDVFDPAPFIAPIYEPPDSLNPIKIIGRVLEKYADDENFDLYFATKARVLEGRNEFKKAEKLYNQFLEKDAFKKSKWKQDVQSSLHELHHPSLSVSNDGISYPKEEDILYLSSRNIKTVNIDIYELDLAGLLLEPKHLNKPYAGFTDTYSYFEDFEGAKKHLKKKIKTLTYKTRDKGDYGYVSGRMKLPELPLGAYLIHGHGKKVEHIALFLRTDMIIVSKPVRDSVQYFVTDSQTGKPLADVPLVLKESYYDYKHGYNEYVKITKGKTGPFGRYTFNFTKGNDISGNSVQILARTDKSMALIGRSYSSYYARGDTEDTFKIFTYSDRPVYRPGDTIRFKHIVRSYKNGKNVNVPDVDVIMEVSNPKGEKIFTKTEKATSFGTVWGEVKVEDGAPLGVYRARAYVKGSEHRSYQSSGSEFRVEEYKKPEFEVQVTPSKKLAAAGDKLSALIKAAYYWGAPVGEATVKYKVYRSTYWHSYRPPDKWDWLYGSGFGIIHDQPYSGGEELLEDGEGVTDETGMMEITLPEMEKDAGYDFEYKVVAEVTDLSRRTINGAGTVKVTRKPFYAYVVTRNSFYTEGDKVEAEILAMTADNEPVAAEGTVEVVRLTYPVAEEMKEEIIAEAKIELDAKGRAFYKTKFKDAGQYKLRFTGRHKGSKDVIGELLLTVAGKTFDKKRFRFQNIEIVSMKRTYKRGDKIRVLVATPWDDATIWLSREGGDEVFYDVIKQPQGGAFVMDFDAKEQHQPNFFVRAIIVRDNRVHTFERELFVPPEEGILEAEVTCNKGEFKPREKGKFTIRVKDHKGKPVAGEFSMSVFDSSVLYIQAETSGDIRPYYYGDRRYMDIYPNHSANLYFSSFSKDFNQWPDFHTRGLPSSSGYFYSPYQPGKMFLCPSCPEGDGYFPGQQIGLDLVTEGETGEEEEDKETTADEAKAEAPPAPSPSPATTASASRKVMAGESAGKPMEKSKELAANGRLEGKDTGKEGEPEEVREYFPDTALWKPDVVTSKSGKAVVDITWPDSLTTWAVRIVGIDGASKVAIAKTSVITTKKMVARLETPRFMTEGDKVKLAAVVRNDYPEPLEVKLSIKITGEGIEAVGPTEKTMMVPAGKDARKDFEVLAIHAEEVKIQLSAVSIKDSDALVKTFEVLEWGSDKMLADSGILRKPGKLRLKFDVPKERRKDTTELTITAEPSIGGSLLRALPYLIHYPYGCVEQTMSRFLPAVLVSHTLKESGVKLSSIPELAAKATLADPLAKRQADVQMAWWEQPVFDDEELASIVKKGLKRLYDFQHDDGGWAWWKWGDSDPYITAYVLIGLVEARNAGFKVDESSISRGMKLLGKELAKMNKKLGESREVRSFLGYALSLDKKVKYKDLEDLYEHRESMSHYGQALIALAVHNIGEKDRAKEAVGNLIDVAWVDKKNKTASFKFTEKGWWRWWNNRVETVAWALRAVMTVEPSNKVGDYFAKWLMLNRQGNHWYSTKDTSFALYGLTLYMGHYKELSPDCSVTISVDGKEKKTIKFTTDNALTGEGVVFMQGKEISDGELEVLIESKGKCSLYANGFMTFFTKEAKIKGAGNEIFIERTYYRLKEKKKKVKTYRGVITKLDYERILLKDGDEVKSGELIEVKIMVESKNDYEYLVFEDFKPAGCEPTALKSGGVFENGAWINREMRDEKVVNFLYSLPQGKQAITYKMRAEIPGKFRILPHKGYAMYAPRVRAISDSADLSITD